MMSGCGFRMELHAIHRMADMLHRHDLAIVTGVADDAQIAGKGSSGDDEGVIAGRDERRVDTGEDTAAIVNDFGCAAVDRPSGAHDLAAVCSTDTLVTETDTEHRYRRPEHPDN